MKKCISYLLAICMIAGLFVLPTVSVGALGAEVLLYDIHYDTQGNTMVAPSDAMGIGTVDTDKQGLVTTGGKSFNYSGNADSAGKTLTLKLRITPQDTNSNRFFQAWFPAGGNFNIAYFKAGGEAGVMAEDRNSAIGNKFTYIGGHTYSFTVTMDLSTNKAAAVVEDETAGETVLEKDGFIVPEKLTHLPRIKIEFTSAENTATILHLMQLTQKEPDLGENVETLVDVYYDPATKQMVPQDASIFDYSGCTDAKINTEKGGLEVSVDGTGGNTAIKPMSFMWPNSIDTKGKLVTVHMVMTGVNFGTRRRLQAFYDGGTTNILETNPSKQLLFFGTEVGKNLDNRKLDIQIQLNFGANTASIRVLNLTDNTVVIESASANITFDNLTKFKLELEPKANDPIATTILHSFSAVQEVKNEISIQPYAIGMPPYTAGDTIMLRLKQSGETPVQITAYCDGQNLGSKTQAPYEWTTPKLSAGTHVLYAVAEYENGDIVETTEQVTAKPYAIGTVYLDSNGENGSLSGIENISAGGTSGNSRYEPMPGITGQGNALLMQPTDGDVNFNIAAKTNDNYFDQADLVTWESDVMFTDAPAVNPDNTIAGQRGLEVRLKDTSNAQKDVIVVKAAQGGNLTFAGSSLTVPYDANTLYHVKLQLNKNGKYNIVVSDTDGAVFSGYNLVWYNGGANSLVRFKFQQNVNPGSSTTGMYLDNLKIYAQAESISYIDTLTVKKDGAILHDLTQIKAGDAVEVHANICNKSEAALTAPKLLFAIVDADGGILHIAVAESGDVTAGQSGAEVSAAMTITQDLPDGAYVKAFAWDNLTGLQPVAEARTY